MTRKDFATHCFVQAFICHMLGKDEESRKWLEEAVWCAKVMLAYGSNACAISSN